MAILIQNKGLSGRFKISGNSTGGFKARYVGSSIDADAQAFFDRVTTAGGVLTATERSAIITLVASLKSANIWNAMKAVYPMVGSSSVACAQNLKSSSFTGTFSSGWTIASTGIVGNGTSAFMDTGFNTSTNLVKTSVHLSLYIRNNSSTGQPYELANGSIGGMTTDITGLQTRYSNNNAYFYAADNGTYSTSYSTAESRGFWCGSRSLNVQTLYRNGAQVASTAAGSGNLANNNLYLGAANNGGAAGFFSDKIFAFASIGTEISAVADFYTAVQAFQTTLGRQV